MTDIDASSRAQSRVVSWPLIAFLFGVACTALPILAHLYLPLVDLPNHIARLHIAETGGLGPLAEYYVYTSKLVPNMAIDLLWRALDHPIEAIHFANLVMASYAVNLIVATMVLARIVHGRWTVWSAAVALIVYNAPFFWGFQNFVWSLPFCLYALALWLVLEQRSTALRATVFVPISGALYLMHFFAFALLAVLVCGRELQTLFEKKEKRLQGFFGRVLLMVPFLLPIIWLLVTLADAPPSPSGSYTSFGPLVLRLRMFASPLMAPNAQDFPVLNLLGALGIALLAVIFIQLLRKRGPQLVLASQLRGAVIALAVVALCAPTWLNGVALVDIRAPVLLVAVLFAGSTWRGLGQRHGAILIAIISVLILARGVAFERFAARYNSDVRDMLAVTAKLPAGSRLLPLRGPGDQGDRRFFHLQGLLVDKRDVFVPTLFQGVHTLKLRQKWASYAHPELFAIDMRLVLDKKFSAIAPIFAQDWVHKFNYALLMDKAPAPNDPRLQAIATRGRFTLFSVRTSTP